MDDLSALIPTLDALLRRAGDLAVQERVRLEPELKRDGSIVTNADRAIEELLRAELPKIVPDAGIWGEEFGMEPAGPNGLWLVDPVDGTSNFAFRGPLWGVTAALLQGDKVTLGGVYIPDLDEMIIAAHGAGVTLNGKALPMIPPGPVLPHELVSCSDSNARRLWPNLPGKLRCTGAFVVDGTFVASQRMRAMIGGGESLYDAAACILFVEELGGEVRYADGTPLDYAPLATGGRFERPWILFPRDSGYRVRAD